jgi:hypothetical protein
MNEIQLRLTADIQGLQSAINKAKQTLKSFESSTATDSEKSNVGFRRKIGLIEQLNAKAKQLKVSLSQATNETQIASFNAQLEETNAELARLNALGKSFANTSVQSFNKFRVSAGAAGGSAIAFNRIIQDAPFGIIGVGNNIQQFTEQLSALRTTTGSTGAALKTFFTSLITPANLVVLAVSAITTAFTAYQLGAFDSLFATESLSESLKKLNESTKSATANAGVELIKLENLKSVIQDETLSRDKRLRAVNELIDTYPQLFSLADKEKLLNGDLVTSYEILTKAIIAKAKASIAEQELPNLIKQKEIVDLQLKAKQDLLAVEEESLKTASRLTSLTEAFTGSEYEQVARKIKPLKEDVEELTLKQKELQINIDGYTQSVVSYANEFQQLLGDSSDKIGDATEKVKIYDKAWNENEQRLIRIFKLLNDIQKETPDEGVLPKGFKPEEETADVVPKGRIEFLEEQIALFEFLKRLQTDTTKIDEYTLKIAQLRQELAEFNGEEVKSNLQLIADAFGSMGNQIANALGISNRSLRGFVTTLVSATPKIVAAILAKSEATRIAADQENIANAKLAAGNSVVVATEGAKALGPVGLALLPVFIAGALALVSSAFSKARGGGGSVSAGTGSTFTNREFGGPVSKGRAYIVGERRPELFVPNTNGIIVPQLPSMDYSGASMAAGAMAVDVNIRGVSYGDDILFTVQQAQIRQGIR